MYHALNTPELGKLEMVEVYNYYDIPILFSCKNAASQLYIVYFADRLPDYDMWLYAEVSIARFNLIRAGKIDLFDTFFKPEMGRLLKVTIPNNNSVEFSSEFIFPSELSEDIFPPVNDYLDIEYTPYVLQTSIVDIAEAAGREIVGLNFKSLEGYIHEDYNAEAPILQLGNVLTCFQKVINIIEATRQGFKKITPTIRKKMQFFTLTFQPGSFEIKLASKKRDDSQMKLFELPSEQNETLTQFFNLLESKDNKPDLKGILTKLGLRTTNEYRYLLTSLDKLDTDITMSWTTPIENKEVVVSFSKNEIPPLIEALKAIEEEQEDPQTIEGELIGLSLDRNRFELQENSEEDPIRGVIRDNPNENITKATISNQYKALIQEIVKRNETTNEVVKIEYILLNLEEKTQD